MQLRAQFCECKGRQLVVANKAFHRTLRTAKMAQQNCKGLHFEYKLNFYCQYKKQYLAFNPNSALYMFLNKPVAG